MSAKSYTLERDEKATQVMVGTSHMLVWGDLVTKGHLRLVGYMSTFAEDFVPLRDAKVLFLAPTQQTAPVSRETALIKREEILFFYVMADPEPLPEESDTRLFESLGFIVGSFEIEGSVLKSPIATVERMLMVAKDDYMPIYQSTIRHIAKPWLGAFNANTLQVQRARLTVTIR